MIDQTDSSSHSHQVLYKRAGLFRLLSSDHFDASMALSYLKKYDGFNVGLQNSFCERLQKQPLYKVEFLLPQLCHFVVTNPIELPIVENFLWNLCLQSIHAASTVLWYLENYLNDFRKSYSKDWRLYYRTMRLISDLNFCLFEASVIEAPNNIVGYRFPKSETELFRKPFGLIPAISTSIVASALCFIGNTIPNELPSSIRMIYTQTRRFAPFSTPFDHQQYSGGNGNGNRQFRKTSTTPTDVLTSPYKDILSLKSYLKNAAKQINSSSPSFMIMSSSPASITRSSDSSLNNQNQTTSTQLTIPLYYYSEMQFLMSLVDVSSKIVQLEKDERRASLIRELDLLNHSLPARVCIPLWCSWPDGFTGDGSGGHHCILRLCSENAVCLNSAERVPFLVQIEILTGDEIDSVMNGSSSSAHSPDLKQSLSQSFQETKTHSRKDTICFKDNVELLQGPRSRPSAIASTLDDENGQKMRMAALMLAQLTRQAGQPNCTENKRNDIAIIKQSIMKEIELIEKNRMLDALQSPSKSIDQSPALLVEVNDIKTKEDPSAAAFQEAWNDKKARIRQSSSFGHLKGWDLLSIIVKSGTDMRQEQLACQLIKEIGEIWSKAGLSLWTYAFRILVVSTTGGLVEVVPDSISIHSLKKSAIERATDPSEYFTFSLRDHFIKSFGSPDSKGFDNARENFINSLAAYSIITYLFQVKDRHDGNILLDHLGHLVHIDFGFMLSNSPGYVGFETAPFKMTPEYIELLGGLQSSEFSRFKERMFEGFVEVRKHADHIILLVESMLKDSKLPCFYSGDQVIPDLQSRFHLNLTEQQLRVVIDRLIISSAFNLFTKLYDTYQYYSNGIL